MQYYFFFLKFMLYFSGNANGNTWFQVTMKVNEN